MIYNQTKIPKELWRYGFRSSAATGCGWIAVYNALELLGLRAQPTELIRWFEHQLPLIHGNLGTTIWGPAKFFLGRGFRVESTSLVSDFDALAKKSQVCILYYRWRRGWRFGAHFVTLQHTETGFVGYNTFTNSTGADLYGDSLGDYVKKQKWFAAVLFGISLP